MKLITISGLDGSGKSTQIELLSKYLESQGKKVFYFHAVQQGFAKKLTEFRNKYCLMCRLMGKCKTGYQERSITQANWLQLQLRKIFLRIDIRRFKKLRNKLRNSGYDYILSDRYFYDSVVNIEYLQSCHCEELKATRQSRGNNSRLLRFARNDIIKPDLSIYLQASPETIMSRDRVPDQGLEYLKKKKELYDGKISKWNMKVVGGNKNENEVFEEINSFLK